MTEQEFGGVGSASLRLAMAAIVVASAAACSTVRMRPPTDVANGSDVFEATGRGLMSGSLADESFRLGPYAVADVDRDWNSGSGTSYALGSNGGAEVGVSEHQIETGFAFEFEEGAETLPARCVSFTERKGLSVGRSDLTSQRSKLVCTCGSGEPAAKLVLEGPAGTVTLARGTFELTGVRELDGALPLSEPAGFRVGRKGEAVGAVEVLRPGRIWLSRSLDGTERRQLGCLMAGVMLYEEPSER